MGWFPGSSSDKGGGDPISSLDPSLREYLETEYQKTDSTTRTTAPDTATPSSEQAPPQYESPYGDRYAHIWKTYHPAEAEAAKSDQERLTEVMQAHRKRKSAIGNAALENCAERQFELHECYRKGGVWSRLTSCAKEGRRFEECYDTQVVGSWMDFSGDKLCWNPQLRTLRA